MSWCVVIPLFDNVNIEFNGKLKIYITKNPLCTTKRTLKSEEIR